MKFSLCIDSIFKGTDSEKIAGVKKSGAEAFEFWAWWNRDIDALKAEADRAGLKIAGMCTKFISLTEPEKRAEYKEGLKDSLEAAAKLGCKMLISQVGNDSGAERAFQQDSIVEGLKECASMLEKAGVTLAVEPLNTLIDHKGYYLWEAAEAFEIIDRINSPCVKVLYDIYHQQVMEGNIVNTLVSGIDKICHIHAAGLPGRAELDEGEINYPFVFSQIKKTGYSGYIGLEYFPKHEPAAGLKKILQEKPGKFI